MAALLGCVLVAACGGSGEGSTSGQTLRLLFAGDLMVGRGIAAVVESDPEGLFEDVRFVVSEADLAFVNLESPLTRRPHVGPGFALEADPAAARLIATAGFDLVSIANNHAGDAGGPSVVDTIEALAAVDVVAVGGGADLGVATAPVILESSGMKVAALAFDVSGMGLPAGAGPGILRWDEGRARDLVERARRAADVVTVSIHGGTEYAHEPDGEMREVAELLATWKADVVWGHGPHVPQPVEVIDPDGDGRPTVVATSLGNFIFDQDRPGTQNGLVLEVLSGGRGPVAFRLGRTEHADRRVHFEEWHLPAGDAVMLGLEWWQLSGTGRGIPPEDGTVVFAPGEVRSYGYGDVTGDGETDLIVAFRRPFRETEVTRLYPERDWADAAGRSAHLGVYRPEDLRERWVAGSLFRPIETLAVCDGSIAVGYSDLDAPAIVATGAWRWSDFGFAGGPELPGGGTPMCSDVDGDGRSDPVIGERMKQETDHSPQTLN